MPGKSHASSDKAKVLADNIQENTKVLIRYIGALSGQRIPGEVSEDALAKLRKMLYNIPAVYNHTWPFQQASLATKAQKIESQDIFCAVAMAQNDILNELHQRVPLSQEAIYFSKVDSVVRFLEIGEQRPRKGWEYAMNKGYLCNLTLKSFLINFSLEMDVLHRDFPNFEWARYEGYGKSRETRKWHQMCKALGDHIMCTHLLVGSKIGDVDAPSMKPRGAKRGRSASGSSLENGAMDFGNTNFATQSATNSVYYVDHDDDTDMQIRSAKRARGGGQPDLNAMFAHTYGNQSQQVQDQPPIGLFQHQFSMNSSPDSSASHPSPNTYPPTTTTTSTLVSNAMHNAAALTAFGENQFGGMPNRLPKSSHQQQQQQPTRTFMPQVVRRDVHIVADRAGSVISDGSVSNVSMQSVEQRTMPTHSNSFPFYMDEQFGGGGSGSGDNLSNMYAGGSQSVGNVASQSAYGNAMPSFPSSLSACPSSTPVSSSSMDMPLLTEAITAPNLRSTSFSTPNFSSFQDHAAGGGGGSSGGGTPSSFSIPRFDAPRTPSHETPASSVAPSSAPNMQTLERDWTSQTIQQFELMQAAAQQLQQIQASFQNLAAQAARNADPQQQQQAATPPIYMQQQVVPQPNDFPTLTFDNSQYFHKQSTDIDHGMDVDVGYTT